MNKTYQIKNNKSRNTEGLIIKQTLGFYSPVCLKLMSESLI